MSHLLLNTIKQIIEEKEKQFKAEIRSKEMGDLGSVRKKLSEIELENAELKKKMKLDDAGRGQWRWYVQPCLHLIRQYA